MKPLISYYGGKQRMAPKIVPLIPPHTVYVEPFAGGAAVFYAKPKVVPSSICDYREVLNDYNNDLVNLYLEAQNDPLGLTKALQSIPFSAALQRWSDTAQGSARVKAAAAFTGYNQAFANKRYAGWRRSTFGRHEADRWNRQVDNSLAAALRLKNVFIECTDVLDCIKKWDSPQTFFYCDPPYLATHTGPMGTWSIDDHKSLADKLNGSMGSWIVSGYDFSRNVLHYDRALTFDAHCSTSGFGRIGTNRSQSEKGKTFLGSRRERVYLRGPTRPVRSSLISVLEGQTCFTGPLLGPCPLPLKAHPSARK